MVYDLGNGRVLKKRRPFLEQSLVIAAGLLRGRTFSPREFIREYTRINRQADEAVARIREIEDPSYRALFGNPQFNADGSYTQDNVLMLSSYFRKHSFEENCAQIDAYMLLTHQLWTLGISETSFLFTQNVGIDSTGSLVQVDFGELTTSKDYVIDDIRGKRWQERYVYRTLSPEFQTYFSHAMESEFTEEKLERCWATYAG